MAKLDGNTLTEYFAAGDTAALRAQAVVDALNTAAGSPMEVTVNIRTGGSPDEIVATGTLQVPWATQSSGIITLGEVQSPLTVTQSGSPDPASWYLEFAAGSRYVWGTFGLTGSGAEFAWSLATFEAGQTAELGTVTLSSISNNAPTFTVAPTSASVEVGDTIQFTATDEDDDPITYSLPTTRAGITISETTGLVSIGSAADDTAGNIVVRASDGRLTADATCYVTVAAQQAVTLTTYGIDNFISASSTNNRFDTVSYQAGSVTNGWRTSNDTVTGWDFSFPAQSPPPLSGMFQFTNNASNWPSGFPGNKYYKPEFDWNDLEPTENNYDFSTVNECVTACTTGGFDMFQLDLRGGVISGPGRTTAPSWLSTKSIPQLTVGSYTYYDISHVNYYTLFRQLLDNLSAYSVGGYALGSHPKLAALIFHGVSSSDGEEADSLGQCSNPSNVKDTVIYGGTKFGTSRLAWVGEDRPWRDINKPIIEDVGIGSRAGFAEKFNRGRYTPVQDDYDQDGNQITPVVMTRSSQDAEQYYNAAGVAQSDHFYLTVDEGHAPVANIRYFADQMEEFRSADISQGDGWADDLNKWHLIWRMCMFRCLQMRRNSVAIESKDTNLMDDNGYGGATGAVYGAEGFVNPAMMKWASVQLGRRVYSASEDTAYEANEAFCVLCQSRVRGWNPLSLSEGFGNNYVENYERWLTQREVDGQATSLWPTNGVDVGYNPSGNDSALTSYPELAIVYPARTGTNIAFRLDDRMRFGSSIAVKVTYFVNNTETWTLQYSKAASTGSVQRTNLSADNGKMKTTTFFINDFSNTSGVNFRLTSNGSTPFFLMRVIKV